MERAALQAMLIISCYLMKEKKHWIPVLFIFVRHVGMLTLSG